MDQSMKEERKRGKQEMKLYKYNKRKIKIFDVLSAVKYSKTAVRYTGAPPPMRLAYIPFLRFECTRPTIISQLNIRRESGEREKPEERKKGKRAGLPGN